MWANSKISRAVPNVEKTKISSANHATSLDNDFSKSLKKLDI